MALEKQSQSAIQIIHYNDVYNIDESPHEPVGGAARFISAVRHQLSAHHTSLVLFSGDAFSPAPLTPLTEGAEMPPILNATEVDVACLGNHELDRGLDVMKARIAETNFPWLCSNVKEVETGVPLGGVREWWVLDKGGYRFGFMGLAGFDWLSALDKVDPEDVLYEDVVKCADRIATVLREKRCDFVVALTHMRQPDDDRLAMEARDVDIVLGGHDHVLCTKVVNGRFIVKSGTDFKNFSTIEIDVSSDCRLVAREPKHVDVSSEYAEDPIFAKFVAEKLELLGPDFKHALAVSTVDLDGRFVSIRTKETALGNSVADALAFYMDTKIALINAGSFRSDCVEPPGKITLQTINAILPFQDVAVVVEYTGRELLGIFENSVSQYPLLDGRFLQVSGVSFQFDPRLPAGERIHQTDVVCKEDDDTLRGLDEDRLYRVAVKSFIHMGKDGYPEGSLSSIIQHCDTPIATMVSEYLNELHTISPKCERRVVCVSPEKELLKSYDYAINSEQARETMSRPENPSALPFSQT